MARDSAVSPTKTRVDMLKLQRQVGKVGQTTAPALRHPPCIFDYVIHIHCIHQELCHIVHNIGEKNTEFMPCRPIRLGHHQKCMDSWSGNN